jgi:hypothetical protein
MFAISVCKMTIFIKWEMAVIADSKLTKQPFNTESELLVRHLWVCPIIIATAFCRNGRVSDASTRLIKQTLETICTHNHHIDANHWKWTSVFGKLFLTRCLQFSNDLLVSESLHCLRIHNWVRFMRPLKIAVTP